MIEIEEAPNRFPYEPNTLLVKRGHKLSTLEWSDFDQSWWCRDLPRVPRRTFKTKDEIVSYFETVNEFV
jgi:hypothetical protein